MNKVMRLIMIIYFVANVACANEAPSLNTVAPLLKPIEIPAGKYVLFQTGDNYGAFRLSAPLTDYEGWKYEWVLHPDEDGNFIGTQVKQGTGKVYENYKSVPIKKGNFELVDQGSQLTLDIGGVIQFEWSSHYWIYPPKGDEKVHIVVTDISSIEKLNISIF